MVRTVTSHITMHGAQKGLDAVTYGYCVIIDKVL